MKYRILACLMSLLLIITALPVSAAGGGTQPDPGVSEPGVPETVGSLFKDKSAKLEDNGTYTINLDVVTTGTPVTSHEPEARPLDIVLVIDQSGSMKNNGKLTSLKDAVKTFLNLVSENAKKYNVNHRIAMVGFASDIDDGSSGNEDEGYSICTGSSKSAFINTGLFNNGTLKNYDKLVENDYKNALIPVNNKQGELDQSFVNSHNAISANGATRTSIGMQMTNEIFKNNTLPLNPPEDPPRKRIVIVFTDGEPGFSGYESTEANAALSESKITKETYNAEVFTIGLYDNSSNKTEIFMNELSSNIVKKTPGTYTLVETIPDKETSKNGEYYIKSGDTYLKVKKIEKDGKYKVECVGIEDDTEYTEEELKKVLYHYSGDIVDVTGDYYQNIKDASKLSSIFEVVFRDAISSETTSTLTMDSVIKDYFNDGFIWVEGQSKFTCTAIPGTTEEPIVLLANKDIKWDTGKKAVIYSTDPADTIDNVTGRPTGSKTKITADTAHVLTDPGKRITGIRVSGFDFQNEYIAQNHPGRMLRIQITGLEATDAAIKNGPVNTNLKQGCGIYETSTDLNPVTTFPNPTVELYKTMYVYDYGEYADLALSKMKITDFKPVHVSPNGMHKFASPVTGGVDLKRDPSKPESETLGNINNIKFDAAAPTVSYKPATTNWDTIHSFYVFGTYTDTTEKDTSKQAKNIWTKIQVVPANSIYYEEYMLDPEALWATDPSNPVGKMNQEYANSPVHAGYNSSDLMYDHDFSNKFSYKTTDGKTKFTFTGTGVDIYGYTSPSTGIVTVSLKSKTHSNIPEQIQIMDTLSASGMYYQIPTVTFDSYSIINSKDVKETIRLPYGTYEVTIEATGAPTNRPDYYLDGIRVYNPIQELEKSNPEIQEAYGTSERNAIFTEVRDLLIDYNKNRTHADGTIQMPDDQRPGFVFIDEIKKNQENGHDGGKPTSTKMLQTYVDYGPKNEVYLDTNQAVVFRVKDISNNYYVGIKSPTGQTGNIQFSKADSAAVTQIQHSTDLYYKVTPDANGFITIKNIGTCMISITKLRETSASPATTSLAPISVEEAILAAETFDTLAVVPYNEVPMTPADMFRAYVSRMSDFFGSLCGLAG